MPIRIKDIYNIWISYDFCPIINNTAKIHCTRNFRQNLYHITYFYNPIFHKKNRNDRIWTCDPCDPNTVRYQTALHSDFLYLLNFIDPHAVWFQLEFGFRSTRQVRYIPIFYIFCILSTLTQFGFNWNWLPFHSPSALFRIYTSCWFSPTICTTILYQKN